jgi:hypothetical protein
VQVVETAIIGKIILLDRREGRKFFLTSTQVCDYLSVITVFDPCILTTAVQGAQLIFVFVQDQLYLATKTRRQVMIIFYSYWERNLVMKEDYNILLWPG